MSDYVGRFIEQTRSDLYEQIGKFSADHACLGRFAGLVIVPINALAIIANALGSVIDTIIDIWNQGCASFLLNIVLYPLILVIQIPVVIIGSTIGLVYDIFAAMFAPQDWAEKRSAYHKNVVIKGYDDQIIRQGNIDIFSPSDAPEAWKLSVVGSIDLIKC